ncbi:HesB/YadR/YfhF family protein [Enterococcus sp. LJL90]
MKITVTDQALAWFKKELTFPAGSGVHFYGKVYGATNVHEGFSVGMSVDQPVAPIYSETIDGILFFVEETDAWFFADYDLLVDYDEKLEEPNYTFSE